MVQWREGKEFTREMSVNSPKSKVSPLGLLVLSSHHHTTTKQDAPWLFPLSAGGGWRDECSAAGSPSPPMDEKGASAAAALVAPAPAAAGLAMREVPKDNGGLSQGGCREAVAPPKTAARSAARIEGLITQMVLLTMV